MSERDDLLNDPDPGYQVWPPWREAARRFLGAGFQAGDVIEHGWFYEAFGLEMPQGDTPLAKAERVKLQFLGNFEKLRMLLLTGHNIDLASVPGVGYRWLLPADQTKSAYEDGLHEIRKGFRKMAIRALSVDSAALTAEQRRENTEICGRIVNLKNLLQSATRKRPSLEDLTGDD